MASTRRRAPREEREEDEHRPHTQVLRSVPAADLMEDPSQLSPLRVEIVRTECQVVVRLAGELDLGTVPRAERAAQVALGQGRGRLVLDLSELSFCDSWGVRAIARMQDEAGSRGFVLHRPQANVRRVFALTGLEERLVITDDCVRPLVT